MDAIVPAFAARRTGRARWWSTASRLSGPDPARSADLARALVLGAGTPEDERAWALSAPLVRDRSVLVPAAHDEPMLRFGLTRGVVRAAAAWGS